MQRLLITGASGQLGAYLLRAAVHGTRHVTAWSGTRCEERFGVSVRPVDLTNHNSVTAAFRETDPQAVIHAAALARVADCHRDPALARRVNRDASAHLAALCADSGARLVHVSTDLVFDGERAPYREDDAPAPVSVYGCTKWEAEQAVLTAARSLVVRVSLLFGPTLCDRPTFFDEQVSALRTGRRVTLFTDEWRTPLDYPTAAEALVGLIESDLTGVLHLGGAERLSRLEMGQRLAAFLGGGAEAIHAVRREDVPSPEPRPRDTSLDSGRWRRLFPNAPRPSWDEALRGFGLPG
jgi:dTDP-4-dehydrorhamnose reductase